MGGTHANILHHIETEFEAAVAPPPEPQGSTADADGNRDAEDADDVWAQYDRMVEISRQHDIGLQKLLQMRQVEGLPVDFLHLGVLFLLDSGKTGRFSLSQLKGFAHWCATNISGDLDDTAFAEEVQSLATLEMWRDFKQRGGEGYDHIADWLLEVARNSDLAMQQGNCESPTSSEATEESGEGRAGDSKRVAASHRGGGRAGGVPQEVESGDVLEGSHVAALCSLLSAADSGVDQQSLLTLFALADPQGSGAESGVRNRRVPVSAVRPFLQQFAASYFGLLANLGLESLL